MKFTFLLTEAEFNTAYKQHIAKSSNKRIGVAMIIIGLLLFIPINTDFHNINSIIASLISAVILVMISLIFGKIIRYFLIKKLYKNNTIITKELTISISKDGLYTEHCIGHSFVTWNGIYKWEYAKDVYLLYTTPNTFYIIPKRVLKDSEEKELIKYLSI